MIRNILTARFTAVLGVCLLAVLAAGSSAATAVDEPSDYQDYRPASTKHLFFEVVFGDDVIEIIVPAEGDSRRFAFEESALRIKDGTVSVEGHILLDHQGLRLDGEVYPLEEITETRVRTSGDETVISFYTRSDEELRTGQIRRGNAIEPYSDIITVDEDGFIRGSVFSVTGNIEIYGEVNQDVITLFGDVFVSPDAVVRGDIVSITGRCDVARDASVYGEVYSGRDGLRGRKHRFRREREELEAAGRSFYDRVDGFTLNIGLEYRDPDSLLPTVRAIGGYAFNSDLWRYEFGLEQMFWRRHPLVVGGSMYRVLRSEDTWLLSREENTAMALIAGEDFLDYYQAEGGEGYVRFHAWRDFSAQAGYSYEETKWLESEPNLWSLFGGNKRFAPNFATVPEAIREQGIAEIDTGAVGALRFNLTFDTRDTSNAFAFSSWAATADLEWSHPDFESSFDYRRYQASLMRYQRLNRRQMFILRAVYGASDGYLPMHKRFFLGGLGTLHGYRHKEYMGSRFWLANAEYRVNFPRTDFGAAFMWDVGQITDGTAFDSEDEVKHSLGIALYIGDDFKVNLSKRLDRSQNDDPKFYVRLAHAF